MRRILFFDRDADVRELFQAYLRQRGYSVLGCTQWTQCLRALEQFQLDALVFEPDALPLEQQQAIGVLPLPTIVTTRIDDQRGRVFVSNSTATLLKPFSLDRLKNAIDAATELIVDSH